MAQTYFFNKFLCLPRKPKHRIEHSKIRQEKAEVGNTNIIFRHRLEPSVLDGRTWSRHSAVIAGITMKFNTKKAIATTIAANCKHSFFFAQQRAAFFGSSVSFRLRYWVSLQRNVLATASTPSERKKQTFTYMTINTTRHAIEEMDLFLFYSWGVLVHVVIYECLALT